MNNLHMKMTYNVHALANYYLKTNLGHRKVENHKVEQAVLLCLSENSMFVHQILKRVSTIND